MENIYNSSLFKLKHEQQIVISSAITKIRESMLSCLELVKKCHSGPVQRSHQNQSTIVEYRQCKRLLLWYETVDGVKDVRVIIVICAFQQIIVPLVLRSSVQLIIFHSRCFSHRESTKILIVHCSPVNLFGKRTARHQSRLFGDHFKYTSETIFLFKRLNFRNSWGYIFTVCIDSEFRVLIEK